METVDEYFRPGLMAATVDFYNYVLTERNKGTIMQATGWIKADAPPSDGLAVLLYIPFFNDYVFGSYNPTTKEYKKINDDAFDDFIHVVVPSHWMPLPSPPLSEVKNG